MKMERNGEAKISIKYKAEDFYNLSLSIESDEEEWNKAIDILIDRFEERYFSTIHYLSFDFKQRKKSIDKIEKNGFVIMAINCLLIDTFYQFEYGLETSSELNPITNDAGVSKHYKDFLRKAFSCFDCAPPSGKKDLAELFYEEIRCGILHSAQTKGSSLLTCDGATPVSYHKKNGKLGIKVDVGMFSDVLKQYFYRNYIRRLKDGNVRTRESFINKMEFVCREISIE